MRLAIRVLDGLALLLAATATGILLTGGFTVAGAALARPEDVVLASVAVVAARALLAPIRLPAWEPRRTVLAASGSTRRRSRSSR